MSSSRSSLLLLLVIALGLLGCDPTATQPDSQVVVESYLQAEAPLPTVQLTRTVDATASFSPEATAVRGASVEIQQLDGGGGVTEATSYSETATPGVYAPVPSSPPIVQTQTSYRLRVETSDDEVVTATTTVPDALPLLEVQNTTADTTAEYQNDAQKPAFVIDPPRPVSDRQNTYLFTVTSQLPKRRLLPNFTPLYGSGFDAEEDSIESLRTVSSGLLNQANFARNDDGTLTVDLPWIGVAFFGPSEVAINVVDDNYYDFLRSTSAQQNAPPGEFPNIIETVDGGTGIFGSYAKAAAVITFTGGGEFTNRSSTSPSSSALP